MKILLTGCAGMLGSAMRPVLKNKGHVLVSTDINTEEKGLEYLDVRDYTQVLRAVEKAKPAMIMHLAAETDVDKCEMEADHAYKTNTVGTQNVALVCQKLDIDLVYISTGAVFPGGKIEPYTEFDAPAPVNLYADSKLQGEKIVQQLLKRYYICRAGWMMGGGGNKDKKFLNKVMSQIQKGAKEIKAVNDKVGTPTYTVDMSKCIANLIETGFYGLYHMANVGPCTRFDIAKKLFEVLGITDVKLTPVSSAVFPLPAPRGRSEAIADYMLNLRGINLMRPWEEAVTDYIVSSFK